MNKCKIIFKKEHTVVQGCTHACMHAFNCIIFVKLFPAYRKILHRKNHEFWFVPLYIYILKYITFFAKIKIINNVYDNTNG